jgi:hypothetical protein
VTLTSPGDAGRRWEPGTAEDLVADADAFGLAITTRMITDWVECGLLAAPAFQKSTQHGSDQRLFSAAQRRLFTDMLQARQRSPHSRIPLDRLAEVIVHVWLDFHEAVDITQARRALRTWARGAGRAAADRRAAASRAVLAQVAHPQASVKARRAALAAIQVAEIAGHDAASAQALPPKQREAAGATLDAVDWEQVYSTLITVSLPATALPAQGIERGYGLPEMPFGLDDMLAMWISDLRVTIRLAAEQVSDKDLLAARLQHRVQWQDYQAARFGWHARSMDPTLFAPPTDFDDYSRQYVKGFKTVLARRVGTRAEAEEQVRTLDALVRRRMPAVL